MATFDFPYHSESTKYPQAGSQVSLGRGWTYASKPTHPGKRNFALRFKAMRWHTNDTGSVVTKTPGEDGYDVCLARLEAFFMEHGTWKTFDYPHPRLGTIAVKFKSPLTLPSAIVNGEGWVENIELTLVEDAV